MIPQIRLGSKLCHHWFCVPLGRSINLTGPQSCQTSSQYKVLIIKPFYYRLVSWDSGEIKYVWKCYGKYKASKSKRAQQFQMLTMKYLTAINNTTKWKKKDINFFFTRITALVPLYFCTFKDYLRRR
jgi:hypothetical protein